MPVDFTSALARLLKHVELRRRFRLDPHATADDLGWEAPVRAALLEVDADQLDQQAECLVCKRYAEVSKLLPRSIAHLGASALPLFKEHAASYWPEGPRRHVDDAARFARFLKQRGVTGAGDDELHAAMFAGSGRFVAIHMPRIIVGRQRRAIQVLFRFSGLTRQFFLYLGALG